MKINIIIKGVLSSLILLFALSCQNNHQSSKSGLVVSSSDNQNIATDAPINVLFRKPVELFTGLDQNARNSVIELTPTVEGKVFQVDGKQLVFQADKPLPFAKEFKVTVHLDKLFNHPPNKSYQFTIKVRPLHASLFFDNLIPDEKNKENLFKLTGRILTSDATDAKKLADGITAHLNNKTIPITIEQVSSTKFSFQINNIKREKNRQRITINLSGKSDSKTFEYTIPPANIFSLIDYEIKNNPEPHIVLSFSDLLSSNQNLKGLIYFDGGPDVKTTIKNNQILVYPNTDVVGTQVLNIDQSIKNSLGNSLDKQYSIKPVFKEVNPEVRFLGKGNILPGTGNWIIPFEAVNLKAVDVVVFKIYSNNIKQFLQNNELWEKGWSMEQVGEYIHHEKIILDAGLTKPDNKWKSYALDLSQMVKSEPGAIYRVGFRFRKEYAPSLCHSNNSDNTDFDSTNYYYNNYYYPNNYKWSERDDPCTESYYYYGKFTNKNFLASNIGLTVKNSDNNEYYVFVRNLLTTDAIADTKIQFYSYQNQLLTETTTNAKGEAIVSLTKEPFLVVAQHNNQYGYLRLKGGSALSYSKFNTNGAKTESGIKGYIFGERGVWRPGDTLFLTFVLQDLKQMLPTGHPVSIKVTDSRDRKVYSETTTKNINNFYVFKVPTSQEAPTGIWKANVQIGNQTFTKSLRVETILPNRLSIKMTTDGDHFTAGHKGILYIESKWLHGGIASEFKATVTENIKTAKTTFKGYEHYTFDDPSKKFYPDEQVIFDDKLNQNGKAQATVVLPEGKNLPGTLKLNFVTKVFEPGGRFSIDMKDYKYSTHRQYVGIQLPEKDNSYYYETGKKQNFKVVTVDNNGNKISVKNLKVEVYKLDWSWWYSSNQSNLANYISKNYEQKVFSTTINTKNGKGAFSFEIDYPNWGNYYVKITDKTDGHSAGTVIYFDWPSSYSRGNRKAPGDASLLSLSLDKEQYNTGETATISFPSSANAKALISIEKNNQIIKTIWLATEETETSFAFEVTKDMTPNVYVFVSVIQPHEQTINDLPIRSYGVIPIYANNPTTVLKPLLTVPEKIKPKSDYTIKVKEANSKKMTYVLAIVDEGLLNLTHFKTPSLHNYFYKKEALAVKTWDLYSDVNGAFGAKLSQVFAIGGDEEIKELGKNKINRFKPVVTFLGPFTLEKGSSGKTHHIKMDNYIGSVRIMVIAGNNGAYGKAEQSVPVKQPLMVLASMPRMLAPGEKLHLPVTIFAMDEDIKNVTLKATTNKMFTTDKSKQTITFKNIGEKIAYVNLDVNDKTGIGKVHLEVTSNGKKADYNVTISIRNPNERVYLTESVAIAKGESRKGKPKYPDNSNDYLLTASVSRIPSINLERRIKYLIQYPYGCVEQTVSAVLPQLFLAKLTSLTNKQKTDIENNIQQAINKLRIFQKLSGGFSYWPNGSYISDWGSSYAGHFLILAKESGYYVPNDLFNNWLGYQQRMANQWRQNKSTYYNNDFEQAYRLFTLALAGHPSYSAMNRLRENKNLSKQATLRLAAAFAIINEKSTALNLIQNIKNPVAESRHNWSYNYGSYTRDLSMALETYLLLNKKIKAFDIFKEIADKLGSGEWMSTQTTAFALYAVSMFSEGEQQPNYQFSYQYDSKKEHIKTDKPVYTFDLPPNAKDALEVSNKSNQTLFLTLETSGIPKPGQNIFINKGLKLDVTYFNMKGKIIDPKSLKQGTDFYVKVEVIKESERKYRNLALNVIIPSGWEILNTRMVNVGKGLTSSESDFEDIRDDRVNLFFDMKFVKTKTFYIMLNAAYPGTYYKTPITCKAMYNNSINAAVGGGMVEVYQ